MTYNEHIITNSSDSVIVKTFYTTPDFKSRQFTEHHHTAFEIFLVIEGQGIYRTKDKEYTFTTGDIICFSTDEIHCITSIEPDHPVTAIVIHFEPRYIWGDYFTDLSLLNIFFDRNKNFENLIDRNNPSKEKIISDIYDIHKEFEQEKLGYKTAIRLKIIEILIYLNRDFNYVNYRNEANPTKRLIKAMEKAISYIDNNVDTDISLDELAEYANMNRSYLCTLFKKLNGLSIWDYITIKRIEKSIAMLKTTDMSILNIGLSCGFNNSANFYRCFKKITGKTPKDYKNNK